MMHVLLKTSYFIMNSSIMHVTMRSSIMHVSELLCVDNHYALVF